MPRRTAPSNSADIRPSVERTLSHWRRSATPRCWQCWFEDRNLVETINPPGKKRGALTLEDPYKILGVPRDASQDDIRAAYRKLAKQHHPDLNPGNAKAEERFKAISAANALLSDPEQRGKFDRGEIDASGQERAPQYSYREHAEGAHGRRYSRAGPQGGAHAGAFSEEDLGDIFSMFAEAREAEAKAPRRGRDEHYTLETAFLDAVNGATRRLTLPDGRALEVKIPPGTSEGQVMRLRGQGGAGRNGGPSGDALIEIHVLPHRFFQREGQDIRFTLPVTLQEAVLGGDVDVPTPRGIVIMRIPPRSDSGTELRLRGRGVPAHDGLEAGNLYAKLNVVLGKADDALEKFLSDWQPKHPISPRQDMKGEP
jgi:DnaJ-class molecular chaperone